MNVDRLINSPSELKRFIADAVEKKNYPTMKEYIRYNTNIKKKSILHISVLFCRKQQLSAQMRQYTTDFSVKKFLEIIPDPEEYFLGKNRKSFPNTIEKYAYHYAIHFLINHFRYIGISSINRMFVNGKSLSETFIKLEQLRPGDAGTLRHKRTVSRLIDGIQNIPLLQEVSL